MPTTKHQNPLMAAIWALAALSLALAACGPSESDKATQAAAAPCSAARVEKFDADTKTVIVDFDAARKLASQTPRSGLTVPITTMQAVRKSASEIETPDCLKTTSGYLLSSMDNDINGFIAFLGQKEDNTINNYLNNAVVEMGNFTKELARIKSCAPDC